MPPGEVRLSTAPGPCRGSPAVFQSEAIAELVHGF